MIPEYRRVLYDVDRAFAVQNEFSVVKAESEKTTASTTGTAASTAAAAGVLGSSGLSSSYDDLDDDDQDCYGHQHDVGLITVITIVDRDTAQSAAANRTCHRRISKDRGRRNRCTDQKRGL